MKTFCSRSFVGILLFAATFVNAYDVRLVVNIDSKKNVIQKILNRAEPLDVKIDLVSDQLGSLALINYLPQSFLEMMKSYVDPGAITLQAPPPELRSNLEAIDATLMNDPNLLALHILKRGAELLPVSYKHISKRLKLKWVNNKFVEDFIRNYYSMTSMYANKLLSLISPDPLEQELIIVDLVDFANRVGHEESLKMLREMGGFGSSSRNILDLSESLYRVSLRQKKGDYEYLCKIYQLCRPFPGYVDHMADVLDLISTFNDKTLHFFLMKSEKVFRRNLRIVDAIVGPSLRHAMSARFAQLLEDLDLDQLRGTLLAARKYIEERRKVSQAIGTGNLHKIYRVLMDMIDRAFYPASMEDPIEREFDATMRGLRAYSMQMQKMNLEGVITDFANYSFKKLVSRWNKATRMEARTILETILFGKPEHYSIQKYLLYRGSNYTSAPKLSK